MTTVVPQSELARRAMDWIVKELSANPGAKTRGLIEEAAIRFDLGPLDVEFLQRFYAGAAKGERLS